MGNDKHAELFDDLPVVYPPGTDPAQHKHNPGGKRSYPLPAGMTGNAVFSECGVYRPLLERAWGDDPEFALFLGMNPSVADARQNDPTVAREIDITKNVLKLSRYKKANIMDYRATHPEDLLKEGVVPRSAANLPIIIEQAKLAKITVLTTGNLQGILRDYAVETIQALRAERVPLYCLALNKNGSSKHSLYIRADSVPIPYPEGLLPS